MIYIIRNKNAEIIKYLRLNDNKNMELKTWKASKKVTYMEICIPNAFNLKKD